MSTTDFMGRDGLSSGFAGVVEDMIPLKLGW